MNTSRWEHPQRIALFLPSLSGGGAERVAVTLANGFATRGVVVDLVLVSTSGPYLKDVSDAVRVVDLRAGRVVKALWPLIAYWRREQPVATLSFMSHANVLAVLAHRLAGRPGRLVISERNHISSEALRGCGLQARLVFALVPWTYWLADEVTAVSNLAARDLEQFARLPAGRVRTIYNPFDLARIGRLSQESPPHYWLQLGQPPVVLGIGRLTEQKDFSCLLRAFAEVLKVKRARLLILGEGELRGELEELAQTLGLGPDAVQMPGFVANPYAYVARSGVFVLSSRWEGLPGVLIEAMACGAPVVSTDCPSGPREILEGGRWGKLVPVDDIKALAHAITSVLSTQRSQLPDVRRRAAYFREESAVGAYLDSLGMHPK